MPNGNDEKDLKYNALWCGERHEKIDRRFDGLETKFWAIILLLVGNLGGIVVVLLRGA